MKNKILVILLGMFLVLNTGCVSYMARQSWIDAQERKAVRIEADGERVLVGLDLTSMAYLRNNWPIALGAAVLDAGMLYGVYLAVDSLNVDNSKHGDTTTSGKDTTFVDVGGDGNTINISGDTSSTPAPVNEE